jgi:hypothetical protein
MKTRLSKTLIVLAMAGLLGSSAALAGNGPAAGDCDGSGVCTNQGTGNGDGNGGMRLRAGPAERMAGMANRLGLTLEQQIRALELFDAQQLDRERMRSRMLEDYGEEICAQRELHRQEFRALLTEEQLALHDEQMLNRARRNARSGNGPGGFECPQDPDGN